MNLYVNLYHLLLWYKNFILFLIVAFVAYLRNNDGQIDVGMSDANWSFYQNHKLQTWVNNHQRRRKNTLLYFVSDVSHGSDFRQVWKESNARCFRESTGNVSKLLQLIKAEVDRWIEACAGGLAALGRGQHPKQGALCIP